MTECVWQCLHLTLRDSKGERGQRLTSKYIRVMDSEAANTPDESPDVASSPNDSSKPEAATKSPNGMDEFTKQLRNVAFQLGPVIDTIGPPCSQPPAMPAAPADRRGTSASYSHRLPTWKSASRPRPLRRQPCLVLRGGLSESMAGAIAPALRPPSTPWLSPGHTTLPSSPGSPPPPSFGTCTSWRYLIGTVPRPRPGPSV